jgi:riboflavin biosynthesis pyrimidine reductase
MMRQLKPGDEIDDLLEPYCSIDRRPGSAECWVMANMVGGLDGSASVGGRVGALSRGLDAELFRLLRALADVVLVGAETVRREKYRPVRLPAERMQARVEHGKPAVPPIAVVSRSLLLDWESPLFTDPPPDARTIVITTATAETVDPDRFALARKLADVITAGQERVDLPTALHSLHGHGARVVLCEGGPTLLGELVDHDLLDELCLTISPLMGGDPLPISIAPAGASPRSFELAHTLIDDSTLFLRYIRSGL